ncbi:hypothetical protein B0H13DRAFT_2289309 [Mycena leptocephala]|nr:hypothetical protein B0H13DRAFT_2289309 [Mycena leptocephala]
MRTSKKEEVRGGQCTFVDLNFQTLEGALDSAEDLSEVWGAVRAVGDGFERKAAHGDDHIVDDLADLAIELQWKRNALREGAVDSKEGGGHVGRDCDMGAAGGYKDLHHHARIARNFVLEQYDERRVEQIHVLARKPARRAQRSGPPPQMRGVRGEASDELHEELLVAVVLVVLAYLQRKRGTAKHGEDPTPSLGFLDEMTTRSERGTPRRLTHAAWPTTSPASVKSACKTRTRRREVVGKDPERRRAECRRRERLRRRLADSNQKETRMA